jgi:hypothetical protein
MFSLVTLVKPSEIDKYFVRHIFRTYQGFDRLFRIIDIRDYQSSDNPAEVTILDRFAMFAAMYYHGFSYENLIKLAGTKNLVFLTSDLHYWSIFPDLITPELVTTELDPSNNHYDRIFEMFDQLDIRHLIACYDCPELRQIKLLRPSLSTYLIELHVDTRIFKDYGLRKKHNIIIYGSTLPGAYPFRHRLSELLVQSRKFKVLKVDLKQQLYNKRACGKGLARRINQSWLGSGARVTYARLGRTFTSKSLSPLDLL